MKINLLLLLFTLVGFTAFGQMEFEQTEFDISFEAPGTYDVKSDIEITNVGTESADFLWNVEVVETTEGWNFFVCDLNKCYGPGFAAIDEDAKNVLDPSEEGVINFHLQPQAKEGSGIYKFHITEVANPETVIQTITLMYNTTSGFTIIDTDAITIYPNPATNYFEIENPNNVVSAIQIYDILGKKALEYNVDGQDTYDVSSLRPGRYFVRIFDEKGQSLKVIRLIKA